MTLNTQRIVENAVRTALTSKRGTALNKPDA